MHKISLSNIRYRNPYYIRCAECGSILAHSDKETLCDIANIANREGWVYNYEKDLIYCNTCKKK